VTAGEDRSRCPDHLVCSREDLTENLRRELLRECRDGEREQRGSSTTGGKKSTVKTIARSSSSR